MLKKILLCAVSLFAMMSVAFAVTDLNTATQADLEKLPDIGPAKAKAIVEYRQKNGPFKSTDDLKNVSGIGEKTYAKLKTELTVGGAAKGDAKPAKDDKKAEKPSEKLAEKTSDKPKK